MTEQKAHADLILNDPMLTLPLQHVGDVYAMQWGFTNHCVTFLWLPLFLISSLTKTHFECNVTNHKPLKSFTIYSISERTTSQFTSFYTD